MKKFLLLLTVPTVLFITGCSSPESQAENHAEELCDCLQEIGVNENLNIMKLQDRSFMRDMEKKAERILPRKVLKIMKEMEKDIADLSKEEKKEYTRAFLKAMIDTDCADVAFDNIPYDMMGLGIDMMERELESQERRRGEDYY